LHLYLGSRAVERPYRSGYIICSHFLLHIQFSSFDISLPKVRANQCNFLLATVHIRIWVLHSFFASFVSGLIDFNKRLHKLFTKMY